MTLGWSSIDNLEGEIWYLSLLGLKGFSRIYMYMYKEVLQKLGSSFLISGNTH